MIDFTNYDKNIDSYLGSLNDEPEYEEDLAAAFWGEEEPDEEEKPALKPLKLAC